MNIAFDAKRAISNFTGLGNYSRSSIRALISNYPNNHYFLYSPNFSIHSKIDIVPIEGNVHIELPKSFLHLICKPYWRMFGVRKSLVEKNIQLYHGLSHEIPFGLKKLGIKSVVTIHDLLYLRFPEFFPWIDRKIYDFKFRSACKNADRIIAISEQTKKDVIQFFNVPEDKIEVVYQSCDPSFHNKYSIDEIEEVKKKYHLPDQYILNVGTVEQRKNIGIAIEALASVDENIHLVIVGRKTNYQPYLDNLIKKHSLQQRVHFLRKVSFKDLPKIYALSKLFVYPSLYEGFGIPIIEALNVGVPVITSTSCGCLREAAGLHSTYIDPLNVHQMAEAMNELLINENKRKQMVNEGLEYVKKFSEQRAAKHLMEVYHQVLAN